MVASPYASPESWLQHSSLPFILGTPLPFISELPNVGDSNTKMSRMARFVAPGISHHITQRGIRRTDIFLEDADRILYLDLMHQACRKYGLHVQGYCLMDNHVHFVAVPERYDSLHRTFKWAHSIYAVRFNRKYGLSGHLFQGRPFSCALDEPHYWAALRYVERNPIRAGMVLRAEEHTWSSARAHGGFSQNPLLEGAYSPGDLISDWITWVNAGADAMVEQRIRENTFSGRPCGNSAFAEKVQELLRRSLPPRKNTLKAKADGAICVTTAIPAKP